MICTKCKQDGIENTALGKTFWYCRACKEEIHTESISSATEALKLMRPLVYISDDDRDPKSSREIQVIGDPEAHCAHFVDASRYISGPPSKSVDKIPCSHHWVPLLDYNLQPYAGCTNCKAISYGNEVLVP